MRLTRAGRAGPYLGRCLHEDALASPRFAGWNRPGSPRVPPSGSTPPGQVSNVWKMRLTRAGRAGPYLGRCLHEDAPASPRFAGWNRPGSPRVPPSGAHRLARSPTFGRCDSHGQAEPALTWVAVSMKMRSLRLASRAGTVPVPPAYPLPAAHRLARSPTFGRCDSHGPAELALTGVAV